MALQDWAYTVENAFVQQTGNCKREICYRSGGGNSSSKKSSWELACGGTTAKNCGGSPCLKFWLPLRCVEQKQSCSRKEVAQPQRRGHRGGRMKEHACSACRAAGRPGPAPGSQLINKQWVTEETALLHAAFCSPKRLFETCIFRALSVSR